MSNAHTAAPVLDAPILTLRRPASGIAVIDKLASVTEQSGLGYGDIVRRYARLAAGPGRLTFDDFVKLRLFEADPEDRAAAPFLGARRNLQLCSEINFRHDWFGMLADKVASQRYLSAHGCPTLPIAAIFRPGVSFDGGLALGDRDALEAFLLRSEGPLFGKPVDGLQSLGSGAFRRCWTGARQMERMDGSRVGVDALVDEIASNYAAGYVFQPLGVPHPDIRALCGERLATARMVTIWDEGGPKLFRAAVKVPVGENWADNFWRPGNVLAAISVDTGRVRRAVAGAGLQSRPVERHPDTGAAVVGFAYPEWEAMRTLAVEAARLMRHVPLIGWDIACTDRGPVIVEMNATPDMYLVQFADRRGVLDGEFRSFHAFQKERCRRRQAEQRRGLAQP